MKGIVSIAFTAVHNQLARNKQLLGRFVATPQSLVQQRVRVGARKIISTVCWQPVREAAHFAPYLFGTHGLVIEVLALYVTG